MPQYRFQRRDGTSLIFEGEKILFQPVSDREGWRSRWWEVQVYRTTEGRWVLDVAYYTLWEGETGDYQVRVADSLEGLQRAIESLVPEHLRNAVYKGLATCKPRCRLCEATAGVQRWRWVHGYARGGGPTYWLCEICKQAEWQRYQDQVLQGLRGSWWRLVPDPTPGPWWHLVPGE